MRHESRRTRMLRYQGGEMAVFITIDPAFTTIESAPVNPLSPTAKFYRCLSRIYEKRVGPYHYAAAGSPRLKRAVEARIAARQDARRERKARNIRRLMGEEDTTGDVAA